MFPWPVMLVLEYHRLTDECAHCTPELFLRKLPVLFRTRLDNIDILRLTISDSIRQL